MSRKKSSSEATNSEASVINTHLAKRLREGLFIISLLAAVFLATALVTYHRTDPSWSHAVSNAHVRNATGLVGAWLSDFLLYLLGYMAYALPLMIAFAGALLLRSKGEAADRNFHPLLLSLRVLGFLLVMACGAGLCTLLIANNLQHMPFDSGGILGYVCGLGLMKALNFDGTILVLAAFLLIGVTLFTGLSWVEMVEGIGSGTVKLAQAFARLPWAAIGRGLASVPSKLFRRRAPVEEEATAASKPKRKPTVAQAAVEAEEAEPVVVRPKKADPDVVVSLPVQEPKPKLAEQVKKTKPKKIKKPKPIATGTSLPPGMKPEPGALPVLSLLDQRPPSEIEVSEEELQQKSRLVEIRLADFGVEAKVMAVHPGPVVTRFELDLAAGTKVSKISALAKDLARSLSVVSVRVVEVIPGKSYIGLELPNEKREVVSLRDILSSNEFESARSPLTLGLGKDIGGHAVVADLAKMPHLLVAGTTGSGKSVGLNTMLMSLLFKSTPKQLRLIMIDPKMLELSIYDDIPHLLAPVVTDMNDASTALRWCVVEMERRYKLMAALGVRNLAGYNTKVKEAQGKGAPLLDPLVPEESEQAAGELEELPQIVVIADEFADMMVVVGKKVETLIARLAQKARAAGIHLIFATQRPSVDVITGLIKANIPSRIGFQVSSKVDSRTVLDQAGAEQLLGHGDMLYLPPGSSMPMRVHGAFVSDDEVHRVVDYLKLTGSPDYLDDVLDESAGDAGGFIDAAMGGGSKEEKDSEQDSYYDQAVEFVTKSRRVSISSVQRRFKIGYNRAANIVEAMEAAGVVSSMEGNGSREVLAPPPVEG